MSDRVVIDGDVSLTSTIDGEGGVYFRLGQNPVIEALNVTENGTYEAPEGVDGYSPVTVDVPLPLPVIEPLDATENGVYSVPEGVDGYNPVTVALSEYEGAYTVEPSTETQTLATAGKVMTGDVTIGATEPVLWKTVTLDEVYNQSGLGTLMRFLGIEESDVRDGYDYLIFTIGNEDTGNYALRVEIIGIFDGYPDEVRGLTIRRPNYSNVTFGNAGNVGRYISAGAVIKIYRFKR